MRGHKPWATIGGVFWPWGPARSGPQISELQSLPGLFSLIFANITGPKGWVEMALALLATTELEKRHFGGFLGAPSLCAGP